MLRRTVLALLAIVASTTLIAWGLSYLIHKSWKVQITPSSYSSLGFANGMIYLSYYSKHSVEMTLEEADSFHKRWDRGFRFAWGRLRIDLDHTIDSSPLDGAPRGSVVALPCWYSDVVWVPFLPLFILFSALPLFALVCGPLRRAYRRMRNRCPTCAYDLTGNVSGVCPECGTRLQRHRGAFSKRGQ